MIEASSSAPVYLNGILCLSMSEKYSLASFAVLVPKPKKSTFYIIICTEEDATAVLKIYTVVT